MKRLEILLRNMLDTDIMATCIVMHNLCIMNNKYIKND